MIFTHTYAVARLDLCSSLSDDNVTWNNFFTTKFLDAEASSSGVTVVLGRPLTFLVCHLISLPYAIFVILTLVKSLLKPLLSFESFLLLFL